jgi:hypothetical protein
MSAARKTDSSGSSVSSDPSTPADGIHKCDTVPPPDGEADPYSAPTKIGPMARGLIDKLMAQAEVREGTESVPPKSGERPLAAVKSASSEAAVVLLPASAPIPRLYDAGEDGEDGDVSEAESGQRPKQSGHTQVMPLDAGKAPEAVALVASSYEAPVLVPSFAAQLAAHRSSVSPPSGGSAMKLVVVSCVLVTLGLAALYFMFLAA